MARSNILFAGMDVHKENIEIALADGATQEVRCYGKTGGSQEAVRKTLRKRVSLGKTLHFRYEAGPCGYELYRYLVSEDHDCRVVAPSQIPKRAGDKVKADQRDAIQLARLFRAGELTPEYVPNREDEAIRDLSRAREDAMLSQKAARQRLKSFLVRHDIRYQGKTSWTEAHLRWLAGEVRCRYPVQQVVFRGIREFSDRSPAPATASQRANQSLRPMLPSAHGGNATCLRSGIDKKIRPVVYF